MPIFVIPSLPAAMKEINVGCLPCTSEHIAIFKGDTEAGFPFLWEVGSKMSLHRTCVQAFFPRPKRAERRGPRLSVDYASHKICSNTNRLSRSLANIFNNRADTPSTSVFNFDYWRDQIGAKLSFSGIAGYAVGNTTLAYRYKKSADSSSAQERCDNRPINGPPSLIRCFLSSYSGAPLSAQICGVVILGLIAGIGIITGVCGERRRWRCYGWLSAIGALGLFFWWLSAA